MVSPAVPTGSLCPLWHVREQGSGRSRPAVLEKGKWPESACFYRVTAGSPRQTASSLRCLPSCGSAISSPSPLASMLSMITYSLSWVGLPEEPT